MDQVVGVCGKMEARTELIRILHIKVNINNIDLLHFSSVIPTTVILIYLIESYSFIVRLLQGSKLLTTTTTTTTTTTITITTITTITTTTKPTTYYSLQEKQEKFEGSNETTTIWNLSLLIVLIVALLIILLVQARQKGTKRDVNQDDNS